MLDGPPEGVVWTGLEGGLDGGLHFPQLVGWFGEDLLDFTPEGRVDRVQSPLLREHALGQHSQGLPVAHKSGGEFDFCAVKVGERGDDFFDLRWGKACEADAWGGHELFAAWVVGVFTLVDPDYLHELIYRLLSVLFYPQKGTQHFLVGLKFLLLFLFR